MWNEATKQLVADEKLVVLGVVQEQHGERARLYKQWKQYKFPIAQDAYTSLGLAVVPVPILIDEYGIVMETRLRPNGIAALVARQTEAPKEEAPKLEQEHRAVAWLSKTQDVHSAFLVSSIELKIATADAHLDLDTPTAAYEAIKLYEEAQEHALLSSFSSDGEFLSSGLLDFRLGVAYRMLFDYVGNPADFSKASASWSAALAKNPNQYIWRRRIQQYGPRQSKPYPFYDWIGQAQQDIMDRGETPVALAVPLSGAEVAQRQRKMSETTDEEASNPDPDAKIAIAEDGLVKVNSTVVPSIVKPGQTVRVHLCFDVKNAKWNNESDEMMVWVNQNELGRRSKSKLKSANPTSSESQESRTVEFEFAIDESAESKIEITGYALVYVCKLDGQCVYRRVEFAVPIELEK